MSESSYPLAPSYQSEIHSLLLSLREAHESLGFHTHKKAILLAALEKEASVLHTRISEISAQIEALGMSALRDLDLKDGEWTLDLESFSFRRSTL